MTAPIRVSCGKRKGHTAPTSDLELRYDGANPTLHLGLYDLSRQLVSAPKALLVDLVRIAAFVYAADRRVARGGPADVFGRKWPRSFAFRIPVANPTLWNQQTVIEALSDTLRFATDDTYHFKFVPGSSDELQIPLPFSEDMGPGADSDLVLLFSGGIDSAAAALAAAAAGRKPILVSHQAAPKVLSRQVQVLEEMRKHLPQWRFPHVYGKVTLAGQGAKEESQRSRAFLFLSIAVLVATECKVSEIQIADNGVTSLNLPRSGQTVGAMASRSTHPRFIRGFQHLVRLLLGEAPRIVNPFLYLTKAEVVRRFHELGHPELLQLTVSCSRTFQSSEANPHCGGCFQCVDRRFAILYEGLQDFDLSGYYATDIFRGQVPDGEPRVTIVNALRFAQDLRSMSDDAFAEDPAFMDALDPADQDCRPTYQAMVDMLRRHSTQTIDVVEKTVSVKDFMHGLPVGSVGWLLGRSQHLADPREAYALRLGDLLADGLSRAFEHDGPERELNMQDVGAAILRSAMETLERECPTIPFGSVTVRPDFATPDGSLFVEFKLVKDRPRVNKLQDEMAGDLLAAKQKNAMVLFVILDRGSNIPMPKDFESTFAKEGKCWVRIVR